MPTQRPKREVERIVRDVSARGVRLRVTEAGEGPPVVLLHGFLGGQIVWEDVVDELVRDFRVVVPDLPGFGESEKPAPTRYAYDVQAFVDAVVDMLAALGLGRVSVAGHGLGGAIALALAADHPELVEKLVLLDALTYSYPLDLEARLPLAPLIGSFVFKQLYGRGVFRRHFRERVYAKGFDAPPGRVDALYAAFNTPAARESAFTVLEATTDTRSLVARIPRVKAPTLVLWGRADRVFPPALGQRLAREIATARLEMLDTGHAPHEEAPAQVAAALKRFFGR